MSFCVVSHLANRSHRCSFGINFYCTGFDPLISTFGLYGNGQDRAVLSSLYRRARVKIICATENSTYAPPDWFFKNGTRIGFRNRNLKVVRSPDGTAVLRIADYRPLSYCDGGTYTCIVNATSSDHFETKDFNLVINRKQIYPLARHNIIYLRVYVIKPKVAVHNIMIAFLCFSYPTISWSTSCDQDTEHECHNWLVRPSV